MAAGMRMGSNRKVFEMAYVMLGGAIVLELMATTMLKYAEGFTKPLPTVGCLALYFFCFFLLSKAIEEIHLGVAYATWSGVGIVVTALISAFWFHQGMNLPTVIGIVLVLTGCVLMNLFGAAH